MMGGRTNLIWMHLMQCFAVTICSKVLMTSKPPIYLNIKRYNSSATPQNVVFVGRTRPFFFQQALDLVPGKPFVFNIDRWLEIQRCGLFRNLTAKTSIQNDNVLLEINGIENPSLSISPEIGVSLSFVRPEVSGGVCSCEA